MGSVCYGVPGSARAVRLKVPGQRPMSALSTKEKIKIDGSRWGSIYLRKKEELI